MALQLGANNRGAGLISDNWPGLDKFFRPDREILVTDGPEMTMSYLCSISEAARVEIAANARSRVLQHHTGTYRAGELLAYVDEVSRNGGTTQQGDITSTTQSDVCGEQRVS